MARLQDKYKEIVADLIRELGLKNQMEAPRLMKISINSGVGEATKNSAAIDEMVEIMTLISGQKPVVAKAKKAVSAFKVREGMDIGVSVTLRGKRMWEFFDKLISIVLPRTKDFRGVSPKAFDGNGNYSIGLDDHTVFPEIDRTKVTKIRNLQINIVTSATDNKSAKLLLDKFGFPFAKNGN